MTTHAPTLVRGWAALERHVPLVPIRFERRASRPRDVAFDMLFCGLCHTDLHSVGSWGQEFPLVPGHEMVGRVTAVGLEVAPVKAGDDVAVSVIVDSCRRCGACRREIEVYCVEGPTNT